jgi:predicted nucleotidyltransferase
MVLNNIKIDEDQISAFCRKYGIKQLALFGSILSERFRPESDVDIMVSFLPDHHYSYFDLLDIKNELEDITGRDIDLVEKDSIKNPYRKKTIFSNMRVIYES